MINYFLRVLGLVNSRQALAFNKVFIIAIVLFILMMCVGCGLFWWRFLRMRNRAEKAQKQQKNPESKVSGKIVVTGSSAPQPYGQYPPGQYPQYQQYPPQGQYPPGAYPSQGQYQQSSYPPQEYPPQGQYPPQDGQYPPQGQYLPPDQNSYQPGYPNDQSPKP